MQGRLLCNTVRPTPFQAFTKPSAAGHFRMAADFEGDDHDPASTNHE